MSERKKILIFGGGSKFGLELSKEFLQLNHDVSIITSSNITNYDFRIYNVDWLHLDIPSVEKLCKKLDNFDILIFNQNYSKINELENISIEKLYMWAKLKKWQQGQYINCHLPLQVCNSLFVKNKINKKTKVLWMLSGCIKNNTFSSLEYKTQKHINYEIVRYVDNLNILKCIGFNPGELNQKNYQIKASKLSQFLTTLECNRGENFYAFNEDYKIIPKKIIFYENV